MHRALLSAALPPAASCLSPGRVCGAPWRRTSGPRRSHRVAKHVIVIRPASRRVQVTHQVEAHSPTPTTPTTPRARPPTLRRRRAVPVAAAASALARQHHQVGPMGCPTNTTTSRPHSVLKPAPDPHPALTPPHTRPTRQAAPAFGAASATPAASSSTFTFGASPATGAASSTFTLGGGAQIQPAFGVAPTTAAFGAPAAGASPGSFSIGARYVGLKYSI